MIIDRDNLWLCIDCTLCAVNGDLPQDTDSTRDGRILDGLSDLGPNLVPDFDTETGEGHKEFDRPARGCDCCGSGLAGEFHRFATLKEET